MGVTYIYDGRIVFSNVTTEEKRFVLLIQVERVDKFFEISICNRYRDFFSRGLSESRRRTLLVDYRK